MEAYRRSIESDSSFALAHYGIAVSGSWWHVSDRLAAIDAAIERSSRLPLSERQLLRAHADWTLGRFREAERGYRAVLSRAPETVAAWYGLGEMLFHLGPLRGRPLTAAEEPFRRVLAFRPSHRASLYHAGLVAARGRSLNRLDTLIATAADHYAETSIVLRQLRAWRIFGSDDTAAQSSFLAEMERDGMLFAAAAAVEFQGELGHAVRILERFDRPRAPAPAQRAAVVAEAVALAGLGRWDAARRLLESERELAPVRFLEFEASIACSPWLPVPEEQLLDLRERVRRTSTGDFDEADPIVVIRSARLLPGSHVRPYLLGMLSARLGDHASALRQAERVAALPLTREYGSLALDLGHAVRGYSAYVNGNAEAARRELEAIEGRFPYIFLYGSVPGGLPHARFLRAKL